MRLQGKKDPPSHKTPKVLGPVWIGRQRDLERVVGEIAAAMTIDRSL